MTTDDILLTPVAYRVLERVPANWFDETAARKEIALALGVSMRSVTGCLGHLVKLQLVERRRSSTIAPHDEIRRVGRA